MKYMKSAGLKFTRTPTRRSATKGIVLHHPAAHTYSPQQIHALHLGRGWIGAGYNIYIRKDGSVWELRPIWSIGAHAGSTVAGVGTKNNSETIGLCVEGMYNPSTKQKIDIEMPKAQYDAVVRTIKDLLKKYPSIGFIRGHKEMPGTSTACPGQYFPLQDFKALLKGGDSVSLRYGKVLRQGDKDAAVKRLQEDLIKLGYGKYMEPYGADSSLGPATVRAIKAFQKDRKIAVDGVPGPDTQLHIATALQQQTVTNADKKLAEAKKLAQQIINL